MPSGKTLDVLTASIYVHHTLFNKIKNKYKYNLNLKFIKKYYFLNNSLFPFNFFQDNFYYIIFEDFYKFYLLTNLFYITIGKINFFKTFFYFIIFEVFYKFYLLTNLI